jgi:SPP1 family predicted phage head-tail adaptor
MMGAGEFDRRISFERFTVEDDGFSNVKKWAAYGGMVWAKKTDVSDGEKARADGVSATLTARFQIRSSSFARELTPKDCIVYRGVSYEIFGIKEVGRNDLLEITAGAEVSNGNSQS